MAFAFVSGGSGGNSKASANNTIFNQAIAASAGDLFIVIIAMDNVGTTDGDLSTVTSVVDQNSNTYSKAAEFTNGQGSALAGATISVWYSILTNGVNGLGVMQAFYSGNSTAKGFHVARFTKGVGTTIGIQTSTGLANDGADAGSITLSSLPSREYLFIRGCAIEAASATGTASTNFTNINAVVGTTGGGAATNMQVQSEYRITTTTSETTNPTTGSADIASVMIAFYEIAPGSSSIKTVMGLAIAGVKTYNGLATSGVKTILGLP